MYKWYKEAAICYAYLSDVPQLSFSPFLESEELLGDTSTQAKEKSTFSKSRWFRRRWTLQELIAPKNVEFYASDWSEIGTKISLTRILNAHTSIPPEVIRGASPSRYTVAARMSWAAGRDTSREEDLSYCLLGLFDVNMPLLYGEGSRAFHRLQEEIFRKSEAYSLLAWSMPSTGEANSITKSGSVLATRPDHFQNFVCHKFDDRSESLTTEITRIAYSLNFVIDSGESRHQFDPPTVTSRGILTTLCTIPLAGGINNPGAWPFLTHEQQSKTLLAWTRCSAPIMNQVVCILLEIQCGLKPQSFEGATATSRSWYHEHISRDSSLKPSICPSQKHQTQCLMT